MTRYADPLRCPYCGAALAVGAVSCGSCGLNLQGPAAAQLFSTLLEADRLLDQLRAESDTGTPGGEGAPLAGQAAQTAVVGAGPWLPDQPSTTAPLPRAHATVRVSGATVPKILLTLGAICLLAAALVFLAVNWSRLGVGGRTTALIVFTLVTGATASWAARRQLRAGLESLGLVTYGLLAFDVVGAQLAGWFGSIDSAETTLVVGGTVLATGIAGASVAGRAGMRFVAAEVVATLGGGAVLVALVVVDWWDTEYGLSAALLVLLLAVQVTREIHLRVAVVGLGIVALLAWSGLVMRGLDLAGQHPSWRELWVDTRGWPLLLAAAAPWFTQAGARVPMLLRRALVGLGGVALLALLITPSSDERPVTWLLTGLALTAASAVATRELPDPVGPGWALPTTLGIVGAAGIAAFDVSAGLSHIGEAVSAQWSGTFTGHADVLTLSSDIPPPIYCGLITVTLLFALQAVVDRLQLWSGEFFVARFGVATVATASWLGVVALDIPVWTWVVSGLALAAAALADWLVTRRLTPLLWALVALSLTLLASFFATSLTLVALTAIVLGAATVGYREARAQVAGAAAAVAMLAGGGWVWAYGDFHDVVVRWTAFVALAAIALLTLLHAAFTQRGTVRVPTLIGLEIGAFLTVPGLIPGGLSGTTTSSWAFWLAAYLTVVGAGMCSIGLAYTPHRPLLWPGTLALAVASWVRLADLGVETPEAYTLPWAVVLLGVGGYHVVRRGAATLAMLGPGLGLALVPSLLWSLNDPLSTRTVILGAACLLLVLAGAGIRWGAPLVYGAVVAAALVVRLASPYISDAVPRWLIIGAAGTLLVVVGLTWERRLSEARRAWRYVRQLR